MIGQVHGQTHHLLHWGVSFIITPTGPTLFLLLSISLASGVDSSVLSCIMGFVLWQFYTIWSLDYLFVGSALLGLDEQEMFSCSLTLLCLFIFEVFWVFTGMQKETKKKKNTFYKQLNKRKTYTSFLYFYFFIFFFLIFLGTKYTFNKPFIIPILFFE